MVGKSKKKLIASLSRKKYRDKTGLFVAEGPKLVSDLIASGIKTEMVFVTDEGFSEQAGHDIRFELIDEAELQEISFQKNPQSVLALFKYPAWEFRFGEHSKQLTLCLDGIQDPGNMGTILRIADWFGFPSIVCSKDSVDVFNPKVVQASMGAIGRVKVHYTDLENFCLESTRKFKLPVFGTFMDGENIYTTPLPSSGLIIMGNEGNGIRSATEKTVTTRLKIPAFTIPKNTTEMESLNVGVATAIVCSEFRRATL